MAADEREPHSVPVDHGRRELSEFDDFVQVVLDELAVARMSRNELARRAGLNAASLRRLLTDPSANPTFATMTKIAGALGLRLDVRRVCG